MEHKKKECFSSGLIDCAVLDQLQEANMNIPPEGMFQKRGTTIVAAYYDNGNKIIMASDRKTSLMGPTGGVGYNWALDTVKARIIDDFTCYGGAGVADPIHLFGQIVKSASKNFAEDNEYALTSFGIAGWVKSLSTMLSMRFGDVSQFVISGVNPRPVIFHISGSMVYEYKTFCVIGSGTRTLRPLIAMNWRKEMAEDEITNLLLDAFIHTRREDPGSGWDEFNAPNVYLLSKKAEEIPGKDVFGMLRARQEIFIDKMGEGGIAE